VLQTATGADNQFTRMGRGAAMTTAILDNQLPYLVVGSQQGGLLLFQNFSDQEGGNPQEELGLKISPNPSPDAVVVTANRNFQWQLYTILGQLVTTGPTNVLSDRYTFDGSTLTNGVYLIRAVSENGLEDTQRLLIIH